MKTVLSGGRSGLLPMILLAAFFWIPPAHAELLDRIAAIVEARDLSGTEAETDIITESEIAEMARPILMKFKDSGTPVDPLKIRKRVLDELVMRKIRDQKAKQLGVAVTEEDLQRIMAKVEADNNLPPGSLPEALAQQGMSLSKYRRTLHDQLLQGRLINKVISKLVTVSEEEIQDLYRTTLKDKGVEEIHLAQILLSIPDDASAKELEAVRLKAIDLIGQLKGGASFATLASQHSDDPGGLEGGEMGWFKRGELLPEMEEVVFPLKKGSVSPPYRSGQGYHIFQMIDRRMVMKGDASTTQLRIKARHILLKVLEEGGTDAEERARNRLEAIRKEALEGTPFADLARQYSDDDTASDGGDLGWFARGVMVPEFDDVVFNLEPGQVSEPIRTGFGWHLAFVEEKGTLDPNSLAAQHDSLKERLMQAKLQSRYRQWLRDIRMRAFVELR
ncbi:MAG: peptidylprolyl isomerase [Magnetococcales bacterium]|nr:peptidylprolyl isomerase [Magnetococcales bacterium]